MGDEIQSLTQKLASRTASLSPRGVWDKSLNKKISQLKTSPLLQAALYLWNDDIDKAHKIAQDNPGKIGNLIHSSLHRRGGDFGNSKYWISHVGSHPIYDQLRKEFEGWTPNRFVDWCEACEEGLGDKKRDWLEKVQARELELIANYCLKHK